MVDILASERLLSIVEDIDNYPSIDSREFHQQIIDFLLHYCFHKPNSLIQTKVMESIPIIFRDLSYSKSKANLNDSVEIAKKLGYYEIHGLKRTDENRLIFEATYVICFYIIICRRLNPSFHIKFYRNYQEMEPIYSSLEGFQRSIGSMDNLGLDNFEKQKLIAFANFMKLILLIIPSAKGKRSHLFDLITRITEGKEKQYITGSGQSLATLRRVKIYETETGVKPLPRPPRNKDLMKAVIDNDINPIDLPEHIADVLDESVEEIKLENLISMSPFPSNESIDHRSDPYPYPYSYSSLLSSKSINHSSNYHSHSEIVRKRFQHPKNAEIVVETSDVISSNPAKLVRSISLSRKIKPQQYQSKESHSHSHTLTSNDPSHQLMNENLNLNMFDESTTFDPSIGEIQIQGDLVEEVFRSVSFLECVENTNDNIEMDEMNLLDDMGLFDLSEFSMGLSNQNSSLSTSNHLNHSHQSHPNNPSHHNNHTNHSSENGTIDLTSHPMNPMNGSAINFHHLDGIHVKINTSNEPAGLVRSISLSRQKSDFNDINSLLTDELLSSLVEMTDSLVPEGSVIRSLSHGGLHVPLLTEETSVVARIRQRSDASHISLSDHRPTKVSKEEWDSLLDFDE